MGRKFKELLLAVKTGKEVSKKDILAGYLNTIYFGRGAYGVQAAARAFFYTDASKLALSQSAVLAAAHCTKCPRRVSPPIWSYR